MYLLQDKIEDYSDNRVIDCEVWHHDKEGTQFLTVFATTTNRMIECYNAQNIYEEETLPWSSSLYRILSIGKNIASLQGLSVYGTILIRFRELVDIDEEIKDYIDSQKKERGIKNYD